MRKTKSEELTPAPSAEESRLAAATLEADRVGAEEEDGAPGTLDRMALAEESLPRWTQTTQDIVAQIEAIGRAMQEADFEMNEGPNRADKSFAHKLIVARQLAKRLEGPSEEISASVTTFVSQLHDVDDGFRAIIERAPAEIEENPDSRKDFCHFFRVVENLSAASSEGLGSARNMIEAIPPIEKTSRDLRPVLRRLRSSLVAMVEAKDVTDSWVGLIEGSGVDCRGLDDQRAQAPEE
jgi:hypothetical protein